MSLYDVRNKDDYLFGNVRLFVGELAVFAADLSEKAANLYKCRFPSEDVRSS
jgi:hypothetical protein